MVLICQMCGSSLDVNKAINNVVTCEYCDVATNIHGFVHLNMSSDERASALMKRGFVLLEFKVWDKAKYVLSKAVEYDSKNANAYVGLLMVETNSGNKEDLALHDVELSTYENYQKAFEFADVQLRLELENYNEKSIENKRQAQIEKEEQKRAAEEEKQREREEFAAMERQWQEDKASAMKKTLMVVVPSIIVIVILIFLQL